MMGHHHKKKDKRSKKRKRRSSSSSSSAAAAAAAAAEEEEEATASISDHELIYSLIFAIECDGWNKSKVRRFLRQHHQCMNDDVINVGSDALHGHTLVIAACLHGDISLVKYLIMKAGANICIRDTAGNTCMHYAATCPPLLSWLLLYGGGEEALDMPNASGITARDIIFDKLHKDVMKEEEDLRRADDAAWQSKLMEHEEEDPSIELDRWASAWAADEDPIDQQMTEEEYRHYIVQSMHSKTHHHEAKRSRRDRQYEAEARARQECERIISEQLQETARRRAIAREAVAKDYHKRADDFFNEALASSDDAISLRDIPFPTTNNRHPSDVPCQDISTIILQGVPIERRRHQLRQEQRRWHPDRWQRFQSRLVEKEVIMERIGALSRILNSLAME